LIRIVPLASFMRGVRASSSAIAPSILSRRGEIGVAADGNGHAQPHGRALGIVAWQKSSARLVAVLAAVLLVAACKGTSVTGGWGNQVDPTTGRPAESGMERGGSGGGGY